MKTERYTFFTDYGNHLVIAENISVFKDKGQRHDLYQVPVSSVVNSESTFMLTKKELTEVIQCLSILLNTSHLYYATINEDFTIKQLFMATQTSSLLGEI